MADVVGVSVGVQVWRVAVYARPFVVDVLTVAGWGEAASFDNRRHVHRGRRVSS